MEDPMEEQTREESQNVLLGIMTITLMVGMVYEVGSWVLGLIS